MWFIRKLFFPLFIALALPTGAIWAAAPLVFPDEPFRRQQPEPGPLPPFDQPDVIQFSLPNGIEVYLVERSLLPTVSIEIVFDGGTMNDPAGKEGLASVALELLREGTERLEKLEFAAALADLGSEVTSFADSDQQGVGMSSLTRHLDATLDLWAETLLQPGLREDELERIVRRRIAALQQLRGSPQGISGRLANSVIWGSEHPRGRIHTEASLLAITLEDCRTYLREHLQPAGARLFIVGDIDRRQIEEKVGERLERWTGSPRRGVVRERPSPRPGRIFFVDVPGAAQSIVSIMHQGPERTAPDYFPTAMMTTVLGGGFSSRINMNIRERHGYAYGAYGFFRYTREGSVFTAGGSIRSDVTREAMEEILREIHMLRAEGVTEEELAREKEGAILSLPSRFATGRQIIGTVRMLVYHGLPLDYYDHFVPNVQAVTREEANAAASRHLHPEDARILVVGDGATVLPRLRELLESDAITPGELVVLNSDGEGVGQPVQTSAVFGAAPER